MGYQRPCIRSAGLRVHQPHAVTILNDRIERRRWTERCRHWKEGKKCFI